MPARIVEYRLWQSHFGSECFPMVAHGWNADNLHHIRLRLSSRLWWIYQHTVGS
jgi:hypothetical protein